MNHAVISSQVNSFLISRENILCEYALEAHRRVAYNEYPPQALLMSTHHTFLWRNKENIYNVWLEKSLT